MARCAEGFVNGVRSEKDVVLEAWQASAFFVEYAASAVRNPAWLKALGREQWKDAAVPDRVMASMVKLMRGAFVPATRLVKQWVKECQREGGKAPACPAGRSGISPYIQQS